MILDLHFPIDRAPPHPSGGPELQYDTERNCSAIERAPGGGWHVTLRSGIKYWVPDHRCVGCEEKPNRYGDDLELPTYATKVAGGFRCNDCGKVCPTLHGLKTHHGSHSRE